MVNKLGKLSMMALSLSVSIMSLNVSAMEAAMNDGHAQQIAIYGAYQGRPQNLYSVLQENGLNNHAMELSHCIMGFLKSEPVENNEETWGHTIRNLPGIYGVLSLGASASRTTGDLMRVNGSGQLGELAQKHAAEFLAKQATGNGMGEDAAKLIATCDSGWMWRTTGNIMRSAGEYLNPEGETPTLTREILKFFKDKGIVSPDKVLPLAATALLICKDSIKGGEDDISLQYNRLVHAFMTRSSLVLLPNAIVATDYWLEGITHYAVLQNFFFQKAIDGNITNRLKSWGINPLEMLSCTALVTLQEATPDKTNQERQELNELQKGKIMLSYKENKVSEFIGQHVDKYRAKLMSDLSIEGSNFLTIKNDKKSPLMLEEKPQTQSLWELQPEVERELELAKRQQNRDKDSQ